MQHQKFDQETPQQIHARLDGDRTALTSALSALGAKLSLDSILSEGVSLLKTNSGSYTQVLDRAIRANPMAIALTSVGLAWLILGQRTQTVPTALPLPGTHAEAVARWEDEGGPVAETLAQTPGPDGDWMREADCLRTRATALTAQIDAASRRHAAPAALLAHHRMDVFAALTKDVRRIMARGLDHLTDEVRDLAIDGRVRAYAAHLQARRSISTIIRDTPLSTGAAFAAAGATFAALLPQSPFENDAFGGPRDQLVEMLRLALGEERQRLACTFQRIAQSLLADKVEPLGGTDPRADCV